MQEAFLFVEVDQMIVRARADEHGGFKHRMHLSRSCSCTRAVVNSFQGVSASNTVAMWTGRNDCLTGRRSLSLPFGMVAVRAVPRHQCTRGHCSVNRGVPWSPGT